MKRKTIILSMFVLAVVVGALYGYTEYNRTNTDLLAITPEVEVTAATLIAAFENDSAAFQKKYTDKVVAVTGIIKRIDTHGNPVVVSLGEKNGMSSIQCSMDSLHANLYRVLREGQTVTIKGVCTGGSTDEMFGTDVILNRCVPETIQ